MSGFWCNFGLSLDFASKVPSNNSIESEKFIIHDLKNKQKIWKFLPIKPLISVKVLIKVLPLMTVQLI